MKSPVLRSNDIISFIQEMEKIIELLKHGELNEVRYEIYQERGLHYDNCKTITKFPIVNINIELSRKY